jgi:hypothetical protein
MSKYGILTGLELDIASALNGVAEKQQINHGGERDPLQNT